VKFVTVEETPETPVVRCGRSRQLALLRCCASDQQLRVGYRETNRQKDNAIA